MYYHDQCSAESIYINIIPLCHLSYLCPSQRIKVNLDFQRHQYTAFPSHYAAFSYIWAKSTSSKHIDHQASQLIFIYIYCYLVKHCSGIQRQKFIQISDYTFSLLNQGSFWYYSIDIASRKIWNNAGTYSVSTFLFDVNHIRNCPAHILQYLDIFSISYGKEKTSTLNDFVLMLLFFFLRFFIFFSCVTIVFRVDFQIHTYLIVSICVFGSLIEIMYFLRMLTKQKHKYEHVSYTQSDITNSLTVVQQPK